MVKRSPEREREWGTEVGAGGGGQEAKERLPLGAALHSEVAPPHPAPPTLLSCPLIKILPLPGLSTIIPARGALKKKRGKTENGAPGAALGNEMSSQKTGSRLAERLL